MRINKYIFIFSLSTVFVTSCNKFLDVEPDNRTEIDNIDKISQLAGTAYPGRDYLTFAEAASDNSEDKGPGVGNVNELVTNYYTWNDVIGDETNSAEAYWNSCYAAIAAANQTLESIEKGNFGPAALPYKGEALVARAYAHHMLAIFFAKNYEIGGNNTSPGVPYVTKPETILFENYNRGTVQSTYDNIQKDLEEGIPLLRASAYKVPKYHFTPEAAHAFASRFFLFKGDWQKVVEHATATVPAGNFVSNLRDIAVTFKNWSSAEFQINFSKSDVKATLLLANSYSTYQRLYGSPRYGYGSKLVDMFIKPNVTGKIVQNKVLNYALPNYTTYKWREYFYYATEETGYPYLPVILLTVDEALMNRAEAYAELGQYNLALNDINDFYRVRVQAFNNNDAVTLPKIQSFYSISDTKAGIIRTILDAKKAEFLQEGMRWIDLMRRNMTVQKNLYTPIGEENIIELKPDDPRRLFQLPVQVILAGIEQNPR